MMIILEDKINDPSRVHSYLPILPATPPSRSCLITGFFERLRVTFIDLGLMAHLNGQKTKACLGCRLPWFKEIFSCEKSKRKNLCAVLTKPVEPPQPEVRVLDVESEEISEADVLVMATDGLWDVMPNERVAEVVHHGLSTSRLGLQRTPSQAASDRKVVNFSDDEMDPEVRKRQLN